MRRTLLLTICCLVLALLLQNSCPFGAAGKSSIMTKCAHCPFVRHAAGASPGLAAWTTDKSPRHFPLFLFTTVKPGHSFKVDALMEEAPRPAIHYAGAFPYKLLKPPNA